MYIVFSLRIQTLLKGFFYYQLVQIIPECECATTEIKASQALCSLAYVTECETNLNFIYMHLGLAHNSL